MVGAVGAPHDVEVPIETVIFRNVGPARRRRAGPEVPPGAARRRPGRDGSTPGRVFDFETDLEHIVDGYDGDGRAAGDQEPDRVAE